MMGVELPAAGSAAFQRTFSVLLHLTGRPFSSETPRPVGPRQLGQFSALADPPQLITTSTATIALMATSKIHALTVPRAHGRCFISDRRSRVPYLDTPLSGRRGSSKPGD